MGTSADARRGGTGAWRAARLGRAAFRAFDAAVLAAAVMVAALGMHASTDPQQPGAVRLALTAQQPQFSVSAQPQEGSPGDAVTVSFSSLNPSIFISGCSASLPGSAAGSCTRSTGGWTAALTVPPDAKEGPTSIAWSLAYEIVADEVVKGRGEEQGAIDFTVRPPSGPPGPSFSVVATPQKAHPGEPVTVSFSSGEPGVTISSCSARFPTGSAAGCTRSGGVWSAALTVPGTMKRGATSIAWGVSYDTFEDGVATGHGDANGSLAFTVLAPSGPPAEPQFSVVARPQEGRPGAPATVTFTSTDSSVVVARCAARFPDGPAVGCASQAGVWTAALTVPADARTGPTSIRWDLSYQVIAHGVVTGKGVTRGILAFTVMPPVGPPAPQFKVVARPQEAVAGTAVAVSFSSTDSTATITSCTARFRDGAAAGCLRSGRAWTATLTVPAAASAGPTSITWGLSYRLRTSAAVGDANGAVAFTVLPPPGLTETGSGGSGTPLWTVVGLALLAVFAIFFLRRRVDLPPRRHRDQRVAGAEQVHALLRAGRPPRVMASDEDPRYTRSVRLEPRDTAVVVTIDEVNR